MPSGFSVSPALLCAALFAVPAMSFAGDARAAEPHIHGRAVMNLAVDGPRVRIELEIPGADMLGFEHQPESDAEKAAMARALKTLSIPALVFTLPAEAACTQQGGEAEADAHHDENHEGDSHKGQDHKKENHEDDDHDQDHSTLHASYNLTCARPEALSSININLFAAASLNELVLQAITPNGQIKGRATPQSPLVRF